jgi:putative ABC transport system substrate-binding protein
MRRRAFMTLLGGAAAWPLTARAQQAERVRRVGVLANLFENDPEAVARLTAFRRSLQELGWVEGRNLQIDARWGVDNDRIRTNAAELIALAPDVILANAPPSVMALQQPSHTVPIVFVNMTDPVGMGIVQSLARPGGNATGFAVAEFGLSAKWLEVLKEIAPGVQRVRSRNLPRSRLWRLPSTWSSPRSAPATPARSSATSAPSPAPATAA